MAAAQQDKKATEPQTIPSRGARLSADIKRRHPNLTLEQTMVLEEAARCADRLDLLEQVIAEKGVVAVGSLMGEARQQQTVFKQLLASLRLPDEETGKRPQQRGGARGAYKPSGEVGAKTASTRVSSLERARAQRAGGDATS